MARAALNEALGSSRLQALAQIGCRVVRLDDPGFQDVEGIYSAYFRENGMDVLLARPDFSVFGAAQGSAGAAGLVDQLLAGLAGESARTTA